MKERNSIHLGISFIYLLITRNFLANGYFYMTNIISFQKTYLYCFILAICLTIILETWHMFLELYGSKISPIYILILSLVLLIVSLLYLSLYYSLLIGFIAFFICSDCIRIQQINNLNL